MTQTAFNVPSSVDLTHCDQEPIHVPGTIQEHGVLLVINEADWTILQVSENTHPILGLDYTSVLNQPLTTVFTSDELSLFQQFVATEQLDDNPLLALTIQRQARELVVIVHRLASLLYVEFEPLTQKPASETLNFYQFVKKDLARFEATDTLNDFFNVAAQIIHGLTGFDRVMVYQFDDQGDGAVIAEARNNRVESFLGLHYPASDIPRQARLLYLKNWLRMIPDTSYTPTAITPAVNPLTQALPDMSYCVLRSVSPIHIEYLNNMGVVASMSISIVKNGELWGLIACHHYTPHYVPYDIRSACEFMGQFLSLQLDPKIEKEAYAYKLTLKSFITEFIEQMAEESSFIDGLLNTRPNLADFINAGGAAVYYNKTLHLAGKTPREEHIINLIEWLKATVDTDVFFFNSLSHVYPDAALIKHEASGLLGVTLSRALQEFILWFRPEVIQTIHWGGDPTKPVRVAEEGEQPLSPRKSFALWREERMNTALPWIRAEVEAAVELRNAILGIILRKTEELAQLNRQLEASNQELDSFAYIASHDLKEPLRGIHNYASLLIRTQANKLDDDGVQKLKTLTRLTQRMEDLINSLLYFSRVGRVDMSYQETDLNQVVQEVRERLDIVLNEANMQIRIPHRLPTVYCDMVKIKEVYSNLIGNALKYNDKPDKWVEIGYIDERLAESSPVFYVKDNGIGIDKEHTDTIFQFFKRLHARDHYGGGTGAGLTIVRKIIDRHKGKVWVQSQPGEGSTFFFTLGVHPKEGVPHDHAPN